MVYNNNTWYNIINRSRREVWLILIKVLNFIDFLNA